MQPLAAVFPLKISREGTIEVVVKNTPTTPELLKDYVRRKRQEHDPPLTLQDVENKSARHGFRVDYTYISKIENGHKNNPTADILVGLHYGLEVPLLEIISVAAGKALLEADAQDEQLLALFHALNDADRDLTVKIVRTMARARGVKPADVKPIKKSGRRAA